MSGRSALRRSEWRWTRWGSEKQRNLKYPFKSVFPRKSRRNLKFLFKSVFPVDGNSWQPALHSSKFCLSWQVLSSYIIGFARLKDGAQGFNPSTAVNQNCFTLNYHLFAFHDFSCCKFIKMKDGIGVQGFNPSTAVNQNCFTLNYHLFAFHYFVTTFPVANL